MVKKYYADPGRVIVVENLDAVSGGFTEFDGSYQPGKDRILICRAALVEAERSLHIILHETVHKKSGANDLTEDFEHALLDVAVQMISRRQVPAKK